MLGEDIFNNTLTNLNNGVPINEEQDEGLLAATMHADDKFIQDLDRERDRRISQKEYEQFEADREAGTLFRYDTTVKYNPKLREKRQRDLVHGIAKLGSAEQGVIDAFSLTGEILSEDKEKPMLGADDANSLAKELGVDVKFDRPTSEAEVRWVVAKKQQEDKMARELAYLSQNTNHGVMQDLMMGCSAVSGAVGFYELAATAGLSLLGGAGVAGALGRFAGTSNNITKAIRLAQKAELAQKRAKVVGNVLNDAKYADIARRRGAAASLAYDAYRFGKGVQGTHASLATTMIPFAVDGVISDLPRIAALSIDSDITHSGRYTGQDVICELMMAGVIGGSLPAIGAGGRAIKSARTKIAEGAIKRVKQDTTAKVMEATEVGHVGEAEIAQQVGEGTEKEVRTLFEDLDVAASEAGKQYVDNVAEFSGANFTEAESTFLVEEGRKRLALGLPMSTLFDQMPCKTPWFSTVPDMMSMLKEAVAGKYTAEDFYRVLTERGYIKNKEGVQLRLFPEGAAPSQLSSRPQVLEDVLSFIEGKTKFSIKLSGFGALEQKPIIGMTESMMKDLHFNIYKARLLEDTEEGVQAGIKVEDYIAQFTKIKNQIQHILEVNEELMKGGVPLKHQNKYILSDGTQGYLPEAIWDLADLFVPAEFKEVRDSLAKQVSDERRYMQEVGHIHSDMVPVFEEEERIRQIYKKYFSTFENLLTEMTEKGGNPEQGIEPTKYYNLRKEKNSHLAKLERINRNIDEMINNAEELYNSDLVFDRKYGDAEKVKQMIEDGEAIPELEYGYKHSSRTSAETKEYLRGDEALAKRNQTLQAEYDAYKDKDNLLLSGVYNKAKDLANKIDKMLKGKEDGKTSLLTKLEGYIESLNNIIAADFVAEKSSTLAAIKASSKLSAFVEAGLSVDVAKTKSPKLYFGAREEIKQILESNLYTKAYFETAPHSLSFETKAVKEAVEQATDEFLENIAKEDAWKAALKPQSTKITESAEEAAQKIAAIDAEQKVINSLADPVIKGLKTEAQKIQAKQFLKVRALMNGVERCFDTTLGRIDENIIALTSGTYVNAKQGNVSVAALAKDINNEYYKFKTLCRKESESTEASVEEYMLNPNNWDELREALLDVEWFEAGLMSEEEKAVYSHTRANTIAGRAARAYHKVLSDLAQDAYDLGASKYNTFNPFDGSKVRNLGAYLKKDSFSSKFFQSLPEDVRVKFQNHHNPGEANAALAFMEWLDLDKHFLESSDKISYNALRDAVVEGHYAAFAEQYKPEQLEKAWNKLYDKILSDDKTGFVPGLSTGSKNIQEEFANASSHYINGLESRFHFKNNDAYKEAVKYMGYDNLRQQFENNVSNAKKALAVLTLFGTEPDEFINELVQMGKVYADTTVRKKHGTKAADLMLERLGSQTFKRQLETLTTATCGNFTSPVTSFVKWASSILQLLGSSLIMKSAVKGIADFQNMYEYLISAGLAQNTSWAEVWSGLNVYLKNSTTNELLNEVLLAQPFMTNALYEATTGAPSIVAGGNSLNDIIAGLTGRNLGKYAKTEDRVAGAIKSLTDGVLHMGCVTTAAEKNRGVAALNLMQNIGREARNKSFSQMDKRFQDMLGRYGIDQAEWDEIFRKHGVHNVDDYLSQMHGSKVELMGDEQFFLPNKIVDIDEAAVRDFMKKHPDRFPVVDDMTVRRYKTSLANKASILINDAADEMCCIPNARIKSFLLAFNDPNTRTGLAWRTLTQFQSFGAGLCWYHWGRRMMSFLDQTDNLFVRNAFIQHGMEMGGWGYAAPQALSFTSMVASMALTTFVINEALATVTGTRQAFHDREGKWQLDAIGKKAMRAVVDQTGLVGVLLDAGMGVFDFGRGTGGGISLSVAPVPSSLLSGTAKVVQAGMRSGNEGRRLQAMGAQTVSNMLQTTGIPRHPLTQAVYTMAIGDWLDQMSMGEEAYNRRYLRKYKENYMNPMDLKDNVESLFTN